MDALTPLNKKKKSKFNTIWIQRITDQEYVFKQEKQ